MWIFFQVVKLETSIIETLNYFPGIIISVKTRSERQLLRLKQMNIQLAAKVQHLEFSCSEKVRRLRGAGRPSAALPSAGASRRQTFAYAAPWAPSPVLPDTACAASLPELWQAPLLGVHWTPAACQSPSEADSTGSGASIQGSPCARAH